MQVADFQFHIVRSKIQNDSFIGHENIQDKNIMIFSMQGSDFYYCLLIKRNRIANNL